MEEKTNIPIEQEGQMTIKKYKIDFQKLSDEQRKSLLTNPSQFIKEGFENCRSGLRAWELPFLAQKPGHA